MSASTEVQQVVASLHATALERNDVCERFRHFCSRVNLAVVIDHSGRAGNGLFQTLFDQHPQVLTCPWMHYAYSYAVTEFGEANDLASRAAHAVWTEKWYFRFLHGDVTEARARDIRKFGGDPDVLLDRPKLRAIFDTLLARHDTIGRRELILAAYFAYGDAVGRDLDAVRYVLVSDTISLRTEHVTDGFGGAIIDCIIRDFPNARLFHLERDPRAGFASCRHQFVNSLGNMYGIRPGNYWRRLKRLVTLDWDWDSPFVFGFWMLYFAQTYRTIERKKQQYPENFTVIRNEDINLRFPDASSTMVDWLGVASVTEWRDDPYVPTMLGSPWTGTGAYNSRYQTHQYGPLANDPDGVSSRVTGPNKYVTERWRSKLRPHEILLIEWALGREIEQFGYEFLSSRTRRTTAGFILALLRPMSGELPTARWIALGRKTGRGEYWSRVFFALTFPPFYVAGRAALVFAAFAKRMLPA